MSGEPQPDNPWIGEPITFTPPPLAGYLWKRQDPLNSTDGSTNQSDLSSTPALTTQAPENINASEGLDGDILGFPSRYLATLLSPQRATCHQKFELIVDNLAFIGHPVSSEADGIWRFKPEKQKYDATEIYDGPPPGQSVWLQSFHLVLVLDQPDPSSSASGNVVEYFDIIYEQIAFTLTAVLFQEQVLSNFVEDECGKIGAFKDQCNQSSERA